MDIRKILIIISSALCAFLFAVDIRADDRTNQEQHKIGIIQVFENTVLLKDSENEEVYLLKFTNEKLKNKAKGLDGKEILIFCVPQDAPSFIPRLMVHDIRTHWKK